MENAFYVLRVWPRIPFSSLVLILFVSCISSCKTHVEPASMFEVLDDDRTGLHFVNRLQPTKEFNMFNYMYFYNGAGIGAGDFNNDGLIDLFFASNQGKNKLYLNKGKITFTDVTKDARIPQDSGWSTGVSVVDINNDGLLDIYVCKVGRYEILRSKNQLLICKGIDKNGIPFYEDQARQYGLDFSGFSTQALFFDYDMDGDLDMFLLNHSVHQNGSFASRNNFLGTYNELSGDRIYRNEGLPVFTKDALAHSTAMVGDPETRFTDVTRQTGINSSAISYGLGVTCADIDLDGYPDLYVGNDFHENDYLYINQRNGTFAEENNQRLMHTSKFSMGVDVADINNDGFPEIITVDMLPADPDILKRSFGDDDYDVFFDKISAGYNYQYSRNNLQLNRRNGLFSETALYSGISASDWSWAPLWVDFDNDGLKDLFISNGIPKRLNDMDYINFISSEEIQKKLNESKSDDDNIALVQKFPATKIRNKFYRNKGDLLFEDIQSGIEDDRPTYSNGAVYADFDNDGDLDIAVNNIDDPVIVYQNTTNDKKGNKSSVEIKLKGSELNRNAVGAKVVVYANGGVRLYENNPVKGFLSSMQIPLQIGLDKTKIDSMCLIWPDNTYQLIHLNNNSDLILTYSKNLPPFNYSTITSFFKNETKPVKDITHSVNLNYRHQENLFKEFNIEPLIPHMLSTEGPALAIADINKDGLEDIFIGSSKTFHNGVFLQQRNGKFVEALQADLLKDSMYEDVDATWIDINNDGNLDLAVASGGNEYYGGDQHLLPRVYLNDGKAHLKKLENAFKSIFITASCIVPYDFNHDGFIDLFIGGRSVPREYGQIPRSYLLQNDGTGKFDDVTENYAKELIQTGMVTGAVWFDIDKDNDKDLIVSCEWNGINVFVNNEGKFEKKILTDKKGWWNFLLPVDVDNDGDIDLVAGNLGLNSRLKASVKEPVSLYYNDFDNNGKKEQLLTYYVNGRELPFVNKDDLEKQLPFIKKEFLHAGDFATSSINEIFPEARLKNAQVLTADYFANALLINNGNMTFTTQPLPWQAQLSSYRDAIIVDANGDNMPDILLAGNYYDNRIQIGRSDADFGTLLVNKGRGHFTCEGLNGLQIKGPVRHIRKISISGMEAFVIARNNDSTMVIRFKSPGNKAG